MARKYSVWIRSLLFVLVTGNCGLQGLSKFEWGSRSQYQRYLHYMVSESFQQDFVHHRFNEGDNFVSRHLLATKNNATKNDSFPTPVRLSRAERISFTVAYGFILLVALTGDFIILVVIATNREFHNNLNWLLCNLIIADLLRMLLVVSLELFLMNKIGDAVTPFPSVPGPAGDALCKTLFAVPQIFSCVFAFTLVFMTFERFVAIVFPFKAVALKNKSKWIIFGVWLSSIVLEIPGLYAFKTKNYLNDHYTCGIDFSPFCKSKECQQKTYKRFVSAVIYISFAIAFIFILSLHAIMVTVLYRNRAKFDSGYSRTSRTSASSTRDVVRMLGVLSIVYVLTSLPNQIYQFGTLYGNAWLTRTMPVYFNYLLLFVANLHSMINPWIYPIFVKTFRAKYAKLFRKYFQAKNVRTQSDASTRSGRATTMTLATMNDSVTNRLIGNNSNQTKF